MDKEIIALFENYATAINSTKCVSWSPSSQDTKVAVCFSDNILIHHIICDCDFKSLTPAYKTIIYKIDDFSSHGEFSFPRDTLLLKDSFSNMNENEKERFLTDPSLCDPYIYPNEWLNTFKRVTFSPLKFESGSAHCLLAALAYNHQLIIYSEQSGEWKIHTDCRAIIKNQALLNLNLPLTIGKTITLDEYVDLMYGMSTVELEWSSYLQTNPESSILLLFTGARNGKVSVWKVGNSNKPQDNCIFMCSDSHKSSVTALKWLTKNLSTGLLAIGYSNGSVRVLEVSAQSSEVNSVALKEIFCDHYSDNLAISDMGWSKAESGTNILLACKQYFIFVYALWDGGLKFVRHYNVESELQLSSISVSGIYGAVASLSGDMLSFTCREEEGDIFLDLSSIELLSLQKVPECQWLCMGVGISDQSCIFLSAHKLNNRSKVMEFSKRIKNEHKIVLFSPFKPVKKMLENIITSTDSLQFTMVHLRLFIEATFIKDGDLTDLLDICKYLHESDTIRSLQILRDMISYLKYWFNFKRREVLEETFSIYNKDRLTERLLIKHIESILQQTITNTLSEQDLQVLKAAINWLKFEDSRCVKLNENIDLETLSSKCKDTVSPVCAICSSEFHLSESNVLVAECTKGHSFKLCSLTFLPCQSFSDRKCEACFHTALNWQQLSGVSLLKQQQYFCILCGGFLK